MVSATLPPGKYYIGDLCYVMKQEIYDGVWGECHGYDSGAFEHVGDDGTTYHFAVDRTRFGDGSYGGTDQRQYCVDAGVIGIVSIALCDEDNLDKEFNVQTFADPVTFTAERGVFKVKSGSYKLVIKT